jgi:predicted regulator of Ras-like GTPase activity (Roadblock/LC7/MglB family)
MSARPTGHWLESKLRELGALAARHTEAQALAEAGAGAPGDAAAARAHFLGALRALVAEVKDRPGVLACFVSHEGLVFEAEGDREAVEALAATSQTYLASAASPAVTANLGQFQQMVVIGDLKKLALFRFGEMSVGILSGAETNLASALQR